MKHDMFVNTLQNDLIVSGTDKSLADVKNILQYVYDFKSPQGIMLDRNNRLVIPTDLHMRGKNISALPFDIGSCGDLVLDNVPLRNVNGFPQICKMLTLKNNNAIKTLNLENTKMENGLEISNLNNCRDISNIKFMSNKTRNNMNVEYCINLEKIGIAKTPKNLYLRLSHLDSLHSLRSVTSKNKIHSISLSYVPLDNFSSTLECDSLDLECMYGNNKFRSFREIENFKTSNIQIFNISAAPSNAICLLLCKQHVKISFIGTPTAPLPLTLLKYINNDNRADYVMDCVLELIEADYQDAAEL